MIADTVGVWVGAILTLLVFSYLLGDTPLFRVAQAIFVGVTVGYATSVAVHLVQVPYLVSPLLSNPVANWHVLIPLVLGLLLLLKLRPGWAALGDLPMAFLFGVGSALAIGGALSGALLPQIQATVVSLVPSHGLDALLSSIVLVVGTIGALLSFHFTTGSQQPAIRALETVARGWGSIGRWFILIAFGAIFAGTAVSRVTLLVGRTYYLLHDWLHLVR